ncbi:MAG: hypothetical protein AB7I33_13585 [Gemmatimonadales bacterium]
MRAISLLLFCAALTAVEAGAQTSAVIDIARVAPGHWRATWHLSAPATSLTFERSAGFFREQDWTVTTPGYRLARREDRQLILLDGGAEPRSVIVADFRESTQPLPKEYELFQPFSDGAVALYTGHFYVMPAGPAYRDSTWIRTVRITPPPGGHGVLRGRVIPGLVAFTDSTGEGTYVYLGPARPIETPDMLAIVDAGMPAWLTGMLDRNLPRLFAAYRDRFDAPLPWKPTVLFSFKDTTLSGYSSGGGTLTGLINMTLTGSAWRTPGPEPAERAFHLIAHEAAHLWNGQLVESDPTNAGAWMHEGAADAMADAMLVQFGVVDSARSRRRQEEALNRCALAVTDGPVSTAIQRGAIRTVYDCGFVMAIWTAAAVHAARADAGLFTFWKDLVHAAMQRGGRYDQELYFSVLRGEAVPQDVIDRMRAFLTGSDGFGLAVAGLRGNGVMVATGAGAPPAGYQQELGRTAMLHLMGQACNRVDFNWGPPIRTGAVPDCRPFAAPMQVYRIEGFSPGRKGASTYDAVVSACAAGKEVKLQDEDGKTLSSVPCTQRLEPRPPWYVLEHSIAGLW